MWNTGPTIKIMNILWEGCDHCTSNVKLVSTRIKLNKWVGIFFAVKIIAMNSEPVSGFQLNITPGKGIPHLFGQSLVLNERIYLMSNRYIHTSPTIPLIYEITRFGLSEPNSFSLKYLVYLTCAFPWLRCLMFCWGEKLDWTSINCFLRTSLLQYQVRMVQNLVILVQYISV